MKNARYAASLLEIEVGFTMAMLRYYIERSPVKQLCSLVGSAGFFVVWQIALFIWLIFNGVTLLLLQPVFGKCFIPIPMVALVCKVRSEWKEKTKEYERIVYMNNW